MEANREQLRSIVSAHHARNPRIFASVVRGEDRQDIDLDLLVDPTPDTTLLRPKRGRSRSPWVKA